MSQTRGRGRVVPRGSQNGQPQKQQDILPIHLPALTPAPPQNQTPKSLVTTSTTAAAAAAGSDWRCAGFVLANSKPVAQLSASKLGSGRGRQLLTSGQPLLLPQLQLVRCSLQQQQQQQKVPSGASAPPEPQLQLPVMCSPADANRFIAADVSKNLPGSYHHVRKPETSTVQLTFQDWLACWQTWTKSRLLLQAHVCNWELSGTQTSLKVWPNTVVVPHLTQLLKAAPLPSTTASQGSGSAAAAAAAGQSNLDGGSSSNASLVRASLQPLLDWPVLQQLLRSGCWADTGSLHLLAGGNDALLPARYETHDRLLSQVSGRQRVLLLPPEQAFRGLYPYPVHHPYDRYSAVDWEDPELEHWPQAQQVHGFVCELALGDSLLVPAFWFLHSQLTQPACVSLTVKLAAQPARLSAPPALMLQLSRMMEVWFGAETGPANVRSWFKALSEGREWHLLEPQLMSVKGYKLLQCCHRALAQLQVLLALQQNTSSSNGSSIGLEVAARQLLALMCDGRLMPTPWLNEGITDPLYLQHPPSYHLIEEDAEAARYSSLFKHRLIGNRSDWMQHATPLQLAPPGSRRSLVKAADVQALPAPPAHSD